MRFALASLGDASLLAQLMRTLVVEAPFAGTPESVTEALGGEPGVVLLRSALFDPAQGRLSLIAARPLLTLRSHGSRCELQTATARHVQYGNPWRIMDSLLARYEMLDEVDLPFPLGGCFGYWGYELKHYLEPKLPRRAAHDLELPLCQAGFYPSLLVIDHLLGKTWVVATGLDADGSRSKERAQGQLCNWLETLEAAATGASPLGPRVRSIASPAWNARPSAIRVTSSLSRREYVAAVTQAQRYIHAGDIYQVNLSHRLAVTGDGSGWDCFGSLARSSPAPFAAYLDGGEFQLASASPELFLRMSGSQIRTRPIKGTRPRLADPVRDAQLADELQASPKENAELVMITDLLRNDLGKVCEYGSVHAPELVRLERYAHVQHLVSTVEGRLRPEVSHLAALAACFPGGSITGAPKFRAMEIIDELEPVARGPYTGCIGYLGFNRESQLSIAIRTVLCLNGTALFHVGAGIVADSVPEAEYEETLTKARGFLEALRLPVAEEYPAASLEREPWTCLAALR
jgi:aminodeoxychorismate synthase component I